MHGIPGMSRRSVPAFVSIQIAASAFSAVMWALLGHVATIDYVANAQSVLGLGQAAHLCVSLGLPTVLPNQARKCIGNPDKSLYAGPLRLLTFISAGALLLSLTGLALSTRATELRTPALAGQLTAFLVSSLTLQQVGRIESRLKLYAIAVIAGAAAPLIWIISALISEPPLAYFVVSIGLTALSVMLIFRISAFARTLAPDIAPRDAFDASLPALRVSGPLIVHMSAYGILSQGVRFTTALKRMPDSAVVTGGYMMLLFTISTTLVGGTNGILGVDIQTAQGQRFPAILPRLGKVYAAIGAGSGVVIAATASLSIVTRVFPGFIPAGKYGYWFILLSVALAGYFLNSSLVLRAEQTLWLSGITTGVLAIYLLTSLLYGTTANDLLVIFALAFIILHLAVALLGIVATPEARCAIFRANAWILGAYVLGVGAGVGIRLI